MTSLKLKPEIAFTPQGEKYLIVNTCTGSTYRVGEGEYLILKQLREATDVEEVALKLRSELGLVIEDAKLDGFIKKAVSLNLIEAVNGSSWGAISSTGLFSSRTPFFNPTSFLESAVRVFRRTWFLWTALAAALFLTAMVISAGHFQELWTLRSFKFPPYGAPVLLFVYVSSIGHELLHGLAASYYGFDVPEVGFQMHYYMPSFYCKILKSRNASRKHVGVVLLAGSLFDLLVVSLLVLVWFFGPADKEFRDVIALAVSLTWVKIFLLNLNPLLPLSDGYQLAGLFISKKRGQ